VEVVASLSQDRTAAVQCGLFTHKSVPVIFEPPCMSAMLRDKVLFPVTRRHIVQKLKSEQHSGTSLRTRSYQLGRRGNCVYREHSSGHTDIL